MNLNLDEVWKKIKNEELLIQLLQEWKEDQGKIDRSIKPTISSQFTYEKVGEKKMKRKMEIQAKRRRKENDGTTIHWIHDGRPRWGGGVQFPFEKSGDTTSGQEDNGSHELEKLWQFLSPPFCSYIAMLLYISIKHHRIGRLWLIRWFVTNFDCPSHQVSCSKPHQIARILRNSASKFQILGMLCSHFLNHQQLVHDFA